MGVKFAALQRGIVSGGPDFSNRHLLSITLDPEFDRTEILAAYGAALGAKSQVWNFATGTKADIEELAHAFSVFTERNGVTLDHTLCTALIGPDGTIVEIWRGNAWSTDEILTAMRQPAP